MIRRWLRRHFTCRHAPADVALPSGLHLQFCTNCGRVWP